MRLVSLLPLLAVVLAATESETSSDTKTTLTNTKNILTLDGTITAPISDAGTRTGHYISYSTTKTLATDHGGMVGSTALSGSESAVTTASHTGNATHTTPYETMTRLVGNNTSNATTTGPTSSSSPVVNTQPCNGYAELCARNYSNITMVAAHNSPFVKLGNVAANQALDVEAQLNDGIRMLQFQTHIVNNTVKLCHTSCDLLDMGLLETYLNTVARWMKSHPYDVVTILIGNYDYALPGNFTEPIRKSGLLDLAYTPPKIPMSLHDWPTLSTMILSGKRAVLFMDYMANQTAYPWLMDEFTQMWETPFSPTDRNFPCTVQRPPGLHPPDIRNRMYLANHNLNLDLNFANLNLLIPNTAQLNQTNAVDGFGSLGWMANNCTRDHGRPPNFLLVDYYNYGQVNGSVFEVAADMNNVTYNGKCCGTTSSGTSFAPHGMVMSAVLIAGVQYLISIF
ncbi:PI-PLC domain-containing protein [Aspergillus affinis]|uniref:PI-PLC domain-containing protein n=1 Tax=Aspergillus affinis TaxID=1070780 RepID=UPI0022FEEBB9|nr:PLC-like phosphodiesterase [Aspergillus affinis]KAI9039461.1 PLC-like phosphodiesterase [Aspergillus affinis]